MKKPVVFVTIADEKNKPYEVMLHNSFKKFHPGVDWYMVEGDELKGYLKEDPMFFYRATPILGERFLKEYDLVAKIDSDSIVVGDLSYIWNTTDYDIGTVINYNREDPKIYGLVQAQGILPIEYMNCGLVAMRSAKFAHEWTLNCFTKQFDRLQYKEQDLLNFMLYYGNWNVRCFDHGDGPANMHAWWGLISKGEWSHAILRNDEIIIPKDEGTPPFPNKDIVLKVIHFAGGAGAIKMNYKTKFSEEVVKRLDYLVGEEK